jgi:hypothetical protein
MLAKQV